MWFFLYIQSTLALAEDNSEVQSNTPHRLEVSFGNSQLFAGSLDEALNGDLVSYLPAQSSLFLFEVLQPRWSVILAGNLPWTGQPTIVDGEIVIIPFAPSVFLGLRGSPIVFQLDTLANIELQFTASLGRTIGSTQGDITFPLLGTRLHVSRPDGFSMYLGTMGTLQRESLALIYGVGNRF